MEGLFYGGGLKLLGEQALANAAAIAWSFPIDLVLMQRELHPADTKDTPP